MNVKEVSNFETLLKQCDKRFPQTIVAGWRMPDGMPVGAVCIAGDSIPTEGETMVSYAACLAAILKKIDETMSGKTKEQQDGLWQLVEMLVGGLEVHKRFKSGLASGAEPKLKLVAGSAGELF